MAESWEMNQSDHSNWVDIYMLSCRETSAHARKTENMSALCELFCEVGVTSCEDIQFPSAILAVAQALWAKRDFFDYFVSVVNDMSINNRRPFIISEGYLGIGSHDVEVGDRLALVEGLPASMVLRPSDTGAESWFDTEYTTICFCFVLDWMDGSRFRLEEVREVKLV